MDLDPTVTWMIMICHYRFISCEKCTTPVGDVDNGQDRVHVGTGRIWEISVPYPQFFCEPKTDLINCFN